MEEIKEQPPFVLMTKSLMYPITNMVFKSGIFKKVYKVI